MKKALIIIAQNGFQDVELTGTRDALFKADCEVVLASTQAGACAGKYGSVEQAAVALRDAHAGDYHCIAFIGGPGASDLASDPDALRIAHEAAQGEILLGAICIAPIILAKARVLDGRKATVWGSGGENQRFLKKYGVQYTGDPVTVDGLIVTGNGPDASEEFGKTLARLLI